MIGEADGNRKRRWLGTWVPVLVLVTFSAMLVLGLVASYSTHGCGPGPRQAVRSIQVALKQYRSDYGKWPLAVQAVEQWEKPAEEGVYDKIMAALGVEGEDAWIDAINPRRVVYLEANFNDDGLVLDPWGNRFRVLLDSDFDSKVPVPDGTVMTASVLVWSVGPNGMDEGGAGDDLISWDRMSETALGGLDE